ncbi:MAG: PAS domain-containing protein, partial [Bradyrhizobium sp.]|uniref:sensor histidine kinase n=1 Tax=Bradyrhizobium sp. TaxID=376 RepID=UPI001DBC1E5C
VWDPQTNVNSWSEEIEELYGLKPGTFGGTYEAWTRLVHPEDLPQAEQAALQSLVTGELHAEWRIVLPDGSTRWIEARARVLKDETGAPRQMIGVNIDITAAKEAERQRDLLLRELAHRVKNSLAVVQSLAYQLLPRSEPKIADFMGRLHALASAHTSLAQNQWVGADLAQLVSDQVLPFAGAADQLCVDGPDLLLPAELTTQLAMVIHELACNASKYGALSVTTGRIVVRWSRDINFVHFRWAESGGPEVSEPLVAGFGSRLLSRTVKNLHREFAAAGLLCEFDIPWQEAAAPAPAADGGIKSSG